ncbi:MAG: hypothetical protein AAGH46_02755 [Bacteroidota bacterium]
MKKIVFYSITLILFSSFVFNSGDSFSELIRNNLSSYAKNNWPEKVYIHTDKPYYTLNENIWFSAYLVNGITHKESSKSKVLYVELINAENEIITSKRLFVADLSTSGHFKIEEDWSPGNFLLRGYTNYMRNEDPGIFFQKELQIFSINTDNSKTKNEVYNDLIDSAENLIKPDLKFFPEGGDLVENINSKVAIKITDTKYQNNKLPIEIVDSEGIVLSRLNTSEFGMGYFYISPKRGLSYFANLNLNGQIYQYPLPKALTQGFGLNINIKQEELLIGLSTTSESGLKNAYLMVHQRGNILFDQVFKSTRKTDLINIYKGNLKDGVVHITLFNNEGLPVCERLVYVDNPEDKGSIVLVKNKNEFESRERVSINLQLQNKNGNSLSGNLSLSVRDIEAIPWNENDQNIKTWFLLNSDLRGKIDNPGYFFSKGEDIKKKFLLDLVMMTNGWRRFTWQDILRENHHDIFDIEKGINIKGTTKILEPPHKEVSTINTLTFLGRQSLDIHSVNSKQDGKFIFGPLVFYDSVPTLVQSKIVDAAVKTQDNYRDVLISIDSDSISSPEVYRLDKIRYDDPTKLNEDFLETSAYMRQVSLQYDEEGQLLEEIVLTAKKKTKAEEREEEMEERSFFGSPTTRLDFEDDDFLSKTRFPMIFLRFTSVTIGARSLYYRGEPSQIYFNDMRVDLDYVKSLNPNDISFIDFYNPNNSIYSRAKGGVFVIYGKIGADMSKTRKNKQPGIINFISRGFDSPMEFFAPDYSRELDQMTVTDVRTTLHWEPQIKLTPNQALREIEFYTCDLKRTYIIEIEGLTDSGIPIYEVDYFNVN